MGTKANEPDRTQPLSMVDALFTKTQQSVLALLFGQPDRSFYTNEIIRKSGSGSGAVQRELARLVRSGLVTVNRVGSQNHYQANAQAPIFEELCALMRKTSGLAMPIQASLEPVSEAIAYAFIYGSVAKQSDSAFSDIDLLIVSDSLGYADIYPLLEEPIRKLGRDIQITIYTPGEIQKRIASDKVFIRRVMEQPKLWIKGADGDLPTG